MAGKHGTGAAANDTRGSFLRETGAILAQTAGDVFGGERKEALEISLDAARSSEDDVSPKRSFLENNVSAIPASVTTAASSAVSFPMTAMQSSTETGAVSAVPFSKRVEVSQCVFARVSNPTRGVIINEIAWMGSASSPQVGSAPSGSSAGLSANEWIEIKNISAQDVDLAGWQIIDEKQNFKIVFSDEKILHAGSLMLLERTDDKSVPNIPADLFYTGGLPNGGAFLEIMNSDCQVVDEIDASSGWPGGDNTTKQTLERNMFDFGWHTSAAPGGTPRAGNSAPAIRAAGVTSGAHLVTVSKSGTGAGSIASSPPGINCGLDCSEHFPDGTEVTFTATAEPNSTFEGWSDSCSGTGACVVVVTQAAKLGGLFGGGPIAQTFQPPPAPMPAPAPVTGGASYLMIVEVQTESGTGKSEDSIKIWNPGNGVLDISNWKLRKRTQSGTEYSLRVFPSGSSIAAGGYFLWANSNGGFSGTVGANVSSTATIADDTSVALEDANGVIVDAVAWGSGHTNPFVEGSPYPENPTAPQTLRRVWQNGAFQDTNMNVSDFTLQ